jgi:hypothetical protein
VPEVNSSPSTTTHSSDVILPHLVITTGEVTALPAELYLVEPEVPPKIKTIEVHPVEAEVIFEARVVSNTGGVAETVEAAEVADLITTVIVVTHLIGDLENNISKIMAIAVVSVTPGAAVSIPEGVGVTEATEVKKSSHPDFNDQEEEVQIGRITNIVVVTKIITTDEVETFNPTFVIMK